VKYTLKTRRDIFKNSPVSIISANNTFIYFFLVALRSVFVSWPSLMGLRDHTHFRHTTLCRTPPDEWSARRRDLYLTIHNTHNRQTSMPPVGFLFVCPGFFPFDQFLYCLNPFVLNVTILSMLPSLQQAQHKHPCPRRDSNPQSQQANGSRPTP
jgi:hypothetical protein